MHATISPTRHGLDISYIVKGFTWELYEALSADQLHILAEIVFSYKDIYSFPFNFNTYIPPPNLFGGILKIYF